MQIGTRTGIALLAAFVIGLLCGWALAGLDDETRVEKSAVVRAPTSVPPPARPAASTELAKPTPVPEASPSAGGTPPEEHRPPIHKPVRREAGPPPADVAPPGAFTILAALDRNRRSLPDLVTDKGTFAGLFPRGAPETVLAGVNHLEHPDRAIEDGVTLEFPPGVFEMKWLMREKDPFPGDVTIQGAGMNLTLLLFGDLGARNRLRNFSVRDCTVFSNGQVFDQRREHASIQLERVRVTGFDIGAGCSCMLSSPSTVFYARDCYFVGGYGRWPRFGRLFSVNGPLLARFENCRIEKVNLHLRELSAGSTVVFDNCVMSEILDWKEDAEHDGALFPGTVVRGYDWSQGEPWRNDLNDLFPDWKERINR